MSIIALTAGTEDDYCSDSSSILDFTTLEFGLPAAPSGSLKPYSRSPKSVEPTISNVGFRTQGFKGPSRLLIIGVRSFQHLSSPGS